MTAPDLSIVHSTGRLVVIDKPAGLRSVPGLGPDGQLCAVNLVRARFPDATGPLSVHRLDMATSGLLVLALDPEIHRALSRLFEERRVAKRYTALLAGHIPIADWAEVSAPMRPDYDRRPYQIIDTVHGRPATTRWRALAHEETPSGPATRVEFDPLTGRSHQLRLHAAHPPSPPPGGLGHPILGDTLYGGPGAPRLMLHAGLLEFRDPGTGGLIRVESPAPF